MNAAVVTSFAAPPRYTSFPDPVPQPGESLVTITAAGLHPIVKALASGTHYGSTGELPFVPGIDGAGRLEDGTRVYFGVARSPYGTFAERGLAGGPILLPIPDGVDDVTAAGIANPGMSSWAALKARAGFSAGESVLVLGATGVAGQMSVQIAKRLGARRVVAAGRNPAALEKLKSLGADAVISLEQPQEALVAAFREEYAGAGIDVVLDYLWGQPAEALLAAIAQKGLRSASGRLRYVQIGSSAGGSITLPAATLRSSKLELLGSGFGSASLEELVTSIRDFFATAAVQPYSFEVKAVPLSEVEALWNAKEQATRLVFVP
ncbi:quinone oxidoreductase family protein [Silvibacterium dinghuense]|uniref:Zinc-binding alcohol dehydrogenase family protein n=1 Tax=Silvibacterium dinghuense TaxID=1560006 RepID=A0A4Q1SB68_9BACT|nr:zinc-binding alcohol dehydrogenase family protein [Silvibacterium dinghuense]RXS94305.1 zinc-binding alcohol dehydrogenase family protein [Silvibacterium dinghuense]GGH17059.1 zinc-binding dehydrogenase [Silvibacterium dinghuense]